MQLSKSKIFIIQFLLLYSFSINAFAPFTDNQCLDGNFTTKVIHKGAPFGLTETKIEIEKKDCNLIIRHEKLKYIKKQWDIDVCRGPIHIKYGAGTVEVIKREGACKSLESDYCKMADELFKVLQDDGLIFATGEKEDLSSSHGKVNCSYLLAKAYLAGVNVFSRQEQYDGILKKFANSWDSIEQAGLPCLTTTTAKPEGHTEIPSTSQEASPTGAPTESGAQPLPTSTPGKADF